MDTLDKPATRSYTDTPVTPTLQSMRLNRALTRVSDAPLRHGNELVLLRDGPATYGDWLEAISRAQRWVHLENYIFKSDGIGRRFAEILAEKAASGIPVRVLCDWFGCLDVPGSFWRTLRRAGVDVRIVNPPQLAKPGAVINRDHRKLVVVDGIYGSLGGVCIADPWMERSPVTRLPYRDTAVRVTGPAVADLERAFAGVWRLNGPTLPPDEQPALRSATHTGDVAARVIIQEPGRMRMLRVLQVVLAGVERRIWIADAYFLAAPILREALIAAARDGVDVRILLPATNDLPWIGALSRYGYRPLLEAGVRIWEYAGLMMHAKTSVADGWWARIGSTNLNISGLETNWEIDLVAEDRGFAQEMEAMYEEDLGNAREIRLHGLLRQRPQPTRPESRSEQIARRQRQVGPVRAEVTAVRIGAAIQAAGSDTLLRHERTLTGFASGALVVLALLFARFPRFLAWPLSALTGVAGLLGLARALRMQPQAQTRARLRRSRWHRARTRVHRMVRRVRPDIS